MQPFAKPLLLAALAAAALAAHAQPAPYEDQPDPYQDQPPPPPPAPASVAPQQEMGRVLSATPVTQQVAIPQQVCGNQPVYGQRPTTGAGAVLGAVAGGAAGNAIGGGAGRAAATALGVIGGALLGNQIESGPPGYQNVPRCVTQMRYENRVTGYNVVYEYAGRKYTTRTATDPGHFIPLSVQPMVQDAPPPGYDDSGYAQPAPPPPPPAYVQPPPVGYDGYPSYYYYRGPRLLYRN